MASLTNTSIKRPIATTMFYLVLLTVGMVGFRYLPVDLLPPIEFPRLTVYVNYPNVGPEEMETIITDPLENALSGVPNLEQMTSESQEGRSYVSLEFAQGTDLGEAANEVRASLDRIRDDLPPEAEPPGIWKFDPNSQEIVTLAVQSSQYDLEELTRVLEREVARRFEQIPGAGTIDVRGGVYREIHINIKRDRLKATGLTAAEVQQAIAQENATLPGGNVKEGLKDLYVRTLGEYQSVEEIANTVITTRNEMPVRVRDVANVVNGYEDVQRLAELNGNPIIRIEIQKQSGANTVTVAQEIREEVQRTNEARDDMQLQVVSDQSEFIQKSINNVKNSAIWGGLLAVLVLYLFLRNGSTTFIIALSIPISVVATFGLLYFAGLTLNLMTFGGLALGIGMIVDNAVVVLENIVRQREEEGKSVEASARVGTREVAGAIVASTLTTSVIFLPLVFMQTTSGSLFQALALVVVFSLMCSLLVALTLVPMLASKFLTVQPEKKGQESQKSGFRAYFERAERRYAALLRKAIRHRYVVGGALVVALVGTLLLWPLIPVELAPQTDADQIDVEMEMAQGTNIAVVMEYLNELKNNVNAVLPMEDVKTVATEVRGGDAEVEISLVGAGERSMSSSKLADHLREAVDGSVPGAEIRVEAQSGLWMLRRAFSSGSGNQAVQVELRGYNLDQASKLAQEIRRRMEQTEGVEGARVGRREGRPEQNIMFDREKISRLGLSIDQVARAIQTNVGGSIAAQFREGGEQYPIRVRLRPEDRLTINDLDNISVETPSNRMIPVSSVVNQSEGRGPTEIRRINGQRVTYISANLASDAALGDAVGRVRENLSDMALPEGFSIIYGGEYKEQQEAQSDFLLAIIMALVLIYMVMAGQFERFLDPLVVMFSVPFALIGVIPTLLLTGTTMNMQSVMGVIMLIGIVVNNAIVLVDYINLIRREQHLPIEQAVIKAGRLRLRPILITTLTTVLGLFPLALGLGAGAEMQAALARVVIGGLIASTVITLVLIPVVYLSTAAAVEKVASIEWAKGWRGVRRLRLGSPRS